MIVRLENGNTEIVNGMNDLRDMVDPAIYEAMQKILRNEIDDAVNDIEEDNYEDATEELQEDNEKLKLELEKTKLTLNIAKSKFSTMREQTWELKNMNCDYKKSKSKRVDKEILTDKLDKIITILYKEGC